MKGLRWIITAFVLAALLAGAYRIVEQRDRALFAAGNRTTSAMPMH